MPNFRACSPDEACLWMSTDPDLLANPGVCLHRSAVRRMATLPVGESITTLDC
jgi:hypothetical protein